jgi:hypothetical protein
MKRILGVLAGAVLLTSASVLQAQTFIDGNVKVTLNSTPFQVGPRGYDGMTGVGFRGNFSATFPAPVGQLVFNDFLMWCIDARRSVGTGVEYTYELWSLADFAASANGSARPYDPGLTDMTRIASLADQMEKTWNQPGTNHANLYGSVWSLFDGFATYGGKQNESMILPGDPNFDISEYYVLYNGKQQTLLTRIPEPSSAILSLFGLSAMLVIVRRRRSAF